jgi:hypothetical protein
MTIVGNHNNLQTGPHPTNLNRMILSFPKRLYFHAPGPNFSQNAATTTMVWVGS